MASRTISRSLLLPARRRIRAGQALGVGLSQAVRGAQDWPALIVHRMDRAELGIHYFQQSVQRIGQRVVRVAAID